ncbi:mucin-17-like [Penaeus monodon]|uniref:mucin-17-like n=1 Tax=Penaeus monodon TaxID=6687 RepID=UPI0018A715C0|nr:mucin-17-like [Penaeus monodon]
MAGWISSVVLSATAVITLGFPYPDAEYNIPNVGVGRRSQFYVLHADGGYKYGYDTKEGTYEKAKSDSPGNVMGSFGYTDPTGTGVQLDYTADDRGFIPKGTHLPQAPSAATGELPTTNKNYVRPVTYSSPDTPETRSDASYSFNYEADTSSRSESADSDLNVQGTYSFRPDDGVQRTVNYRAGSGIGFVAEGSHLPVAPTGSRASTASRPVAATKASSPTTYSAPSGVASVGSSSSPDGSYSFNYKTDDSSRSESADSDLNVQGTYSFRPDDGVQRTVTYRAGSGTGFVAEGSHLPVAPSGSGASTASRPVAATKASSPTTYSAPSGVSSVGSSSSPDGSYSFNYKTDDSSRSESADSALNVQGSYSFRPDDGVQRTVNYRAGSGTGFVAEGSHLPVAPSGSGASTASRPVAATKASSPTTYSAPSGVSSVGSSSSPDGSYSFNYKTDDSSRSESADSALNVQGSFSFRPDDGIRRTVNYRAGSGTGFVAEGSHLPVAPSSASETSPGVSSPVATKKDRPTTYSAPQVSQVKSSSSPDGSYSFNYETDTSSRSESADSDLNVRGTYSFSPDDGVQRTVNYRAGGGIGFVAEGSHLPVAPSGSGASTASQPLSSSSTTYSAPSGVAYVGSSSVGSSSSPDGSYRFSYKTDDSSRSESADSALNVQGSYSFRPDDGVQRTVNYRAGSGTGFVAEGSHLPVAPSGSGASTASRPVAATKASSPTTYSAPSGVSSVGSSSSPDGSYSFNYKTDDSSRSESADSALNVQGSYSFRPDDGVQRIVNYRAGSGTGFVAEGSHLPVAPSGSGASTASRPVAATKASSPTTYSAPSGVSSVGSSSSPDGSYSFNYKTDDSSRSESADSALNVQGSYSFRPDDGVQRTVNYRAGSGTGFVAEGSHLPVAPSGSGASTASRPVAATKASSPTTYSAPSGVASVGSSSSPDGSYSFNYKTDDSSRSESADSDLNVQGTYSFRPDDGVQRTVTYRAGSGTGFVAEGSHLPVAPSGTSRTRPGVSSPVATKSNRPSTYSAPSGTAQVKSSSSSDGSYSFSYDADTSSRAESADSNLNVQGTYSFNADDGIQRTVNYRAGSATGFIAEGKHLPTASTDVSSHSQPLITVKSSPSSVYRSSPGVQSSRSRTVGNVLLHQYDSTNKAGKYGYVFTELRRYLTTWKTKAWLQLEPGRGGQRALLESPRLGARPGESIRSRHRDPNSSAANMRTWTSLTVLSVAVVSTLSFPRPDAEYKIPTVGVGARAQYYVLHDDGTFKYGYDTGDGAYESAMANAPGDVSGSFGYKDASGADIKLDYTANDQGFLVSGSHLPVAPVAEFGSRVSTKSASTTYNALAVPSRPIVSTQPIAPQTPVEEAQVRSSAFDDGSYSFSYETQSSSRHESADALNNVKGRYSFIADDNINREIQYVAGADTGYIAEGDSLPQGPSVPGAESGIPTGRILPVLSEEEANKLAAATSGSVSGSLLTGATYSSTSGSPLTGATYSSPRDSAPRDASYSFSYDAGQSSRSESADPNLNVQGTFSFDADDGIRRTVNYVAGSATGFVAEGKHLPVAPDADFGSRIQSSSPGVVSTKSAATTYGAPAPSRSAAPSQPAAPAAPVEEAQVRSSALDDGSYSFSYETQSSSRHESADALNNVRGRYSFIADDNINREIQYVAGADTGYIAEGDSLPQGPSVPGAESGIPTGRILPVLSEEEANKLAAATSGSVSGRPLTGATYSSTSGSPLTGATYSSPRDSAPRDASYSFSYDAGQSSRSESADPNLNVQGTFSFDADDGIRRTVNYVAGSATGFVAEGKHLPVAPDADFGSRIQSSSPGVVSTKSAATTYGAPAPSRSAAPSQPAAPAAPVEEAQVRSSSLDDGSYSFSYETQSSSRHESADALNNVRGRYSFVADDDVNREIQYVAGSDTGYIAEGDSLPQGPSVPGAESGIPTGRILPVLSEEEANALAGVSPLLKSGEGSNIADTEADASYKFSFDSDSYSRTEEADADGNIVGSYTYVDEDGKEHTVSFVAGRKTGFLPKGVFEPKAAAGDATPVAVASPAYSSPSKPTGVTVVQAARPVVITKAAGSSATSGSHTSHVVGDVLLHQYSAVNSPKYGYVFTAVR